MRAQVLNLVSPERFQTMGTPVLRGRAFTVQETEPNRKVAILNERTDR